MDRYDVIVVGSGYHGCACGYFLSKAGLKTLLIDKGMIAGGASGSNFGNVQVQDASLGLNLDITLAGYERMKTMEEELGCNISYRSRGSLLVAEKEAYLLELRKVYEGKKEAGLAVKWLEGDAISEMEPAIFPGSVLAASYFEEGNLYPFDYINALITRARDYGLEIRTKTLVQALRMEAGRCTGVILDDGEEIRAEHVVVSAAGGTKELCETAGLGVDVHVMKAECFVTEALQPFLRNYYSSAGFFADAHGSEGASMSLCISQSHYGNLLIAETSKFFSSVAPEYVDSTSPEHLRCVWKEVSRVFPALKEVNILRSWVTASPYTDTHEPYFGKSPVEGLLLASGFKSSVVVSGIVGETIRDLIVKDSCLFDLSYYTDRIRRL